MTLEEYLAKLKELQQDAERAFIAQVPSLEKFAYQVMSNFIDNNLDVRGGRLVADERALLALNTFADQYMGAFTLSQEYTGAVSKYLKNFKTISDLMAEYRNTNKMQVSPAVIGPTQEIVINEIVNRYTENGLNAGFVQPLRQLLFNNVTGNMNKVDALAQLREYIAGGKDQTGKLGRYLEQTAQQGVDSYTGAINTKVMQQFKIQTMIMSGSLIETSSLQCRYAINELGGIIDRDEWPELEELASTEGLIEGTTFDNLPFNKLHWGCRHEFTPAVLSEAQRRAITQTRTNK